MKSRRRPPICASAWAKLDSWDKIKLLTVQVNRLQRWHSLGLLCIGDAAHAMSPMGGVGINLAIQDAVATANILAEPIRDKKVSEETLGLVQKRREWPTQMTQKLQVFLQNTFLVHVLGSHEKIKPPLFPRLLARFSDSPENSRARDRHGIPAGACAYAGSSLTLG